MFLKSDHYTIANLTDGHSDLSTARFFYTYTRVQHDDITPSEEFMALKGTFTLEGGTYSIIENGLIKTFSDTTKTFDLTSDMSLGDDEISYSAVDSANNPIRFFGYAEAGLAYVTARWKFPDMPLLNGHETMRGFISTQEQLENFVPYVELESADGKITGFQWRLVNSSDVNTAIAVTEHPIGVRVEARNENNERCYRGSTEWTQYPEQIVEGTVTFDNPVSDISRVEVWLYYPDYSPGRHIWRFYNFKDTETTLSITHNSGASLINGKSDYSDAKFSHFYICAVNNDVIAEEKYFTDEGKMNIPSGTYALRNYWTGESIKSDDSYPAKTYSLRIDPEVDFGDNWVEYIPVDDNGNHLTFAGEAENYFNGKTISWTLPDELNMNGSGTTPNFKTTTQQLQTIVPYIEVESEDNYITVIKYKLVASNDTSTAVTPSYNTDFRIFVDVEGGIFSRL